MSVANSVPVSDPVFSQSSNKTRYPLSYSITTSELNENDGNPM